MQSVVLRSSTGYDVPAVKHTTGTYAVSVSEEAEVRFGSFPITSDFKIIFIK